MKIHIASDHAGVDLKAKISQALTAQHYEIKDHGPNTTDSVDYPDYAKALCKDVLAKEGSKGILICGSGQGMTMAANKYKGIRAALCYGERGLEMAELSRQHNNSNVLVLASRFDDEKKAQEITKTWLETDFEGGRHQTRVDKIDRC